jgi:hypothetical protein
VIRGISRHFAVSEDALSRHKAHVGEAIVRASERREERHGDNLLAQIGRVQEKLWAVLGKMETEGDHRGSVVALRELRESLETIDRMTTREAGGAGELAVLREITERMRAAAKRVGDRRVAQGDGNGRSVLAIDRKSHKSPPRSESQSARSESAPDNS